MKEQKTQRKNMIEDMITNQKGITLIALVVTIIILLILAGVTLNIALSDNGLFNKSKQAVEKYKESERNQTEVLNDMDRELGTLLNEYGGSGTPQPEEPKEGTLQYAIKQITGKETENTKVTIGGQEVVIPAGFTISADSAEQVSGGIVVKDKKGNEWVWVPCTSYERHSFCGEDIENPEDEGVEYYLEEETESITNQKASVSKNKGYYIGRYEAGNDGSDNVIIQKDKTPYDNIEVADCIDKSNSFAVDNNYDTSKMFTTLCSSYAWDSALTFIENTNEGYATNSTQGNYRNSDLDYYELLNTGLTTAVCNIYDMGGNFYEYTTESFANEYCPYVKRGGYFQHYSDEGPAGLRNSSNGRRRQWISPYFVRQVKNFASA